jgi:hypothetical protein
MTGKSGIKSVIFLKTVPKPADLVFLNVYFRVDLGDTQTRDPFTDQRRFAKTGRGRDKGQFTVQSLVEFFNEVRAGDE